MSHNALISLVKIDPQVMTFENLFHLIHCRILEYSQTNRHVIDNESLFLNEYKLRLND